MFLKVNCSECNKEIQIEKFRYNTRLKRSKSGKIYCSPKCSKAEKSRLSIIEVECVICKKKFNRKKSKVNYNNLRGSENLCSQTCQIENARRLNTKYKEKTKTITCKRCGKLKDISIYSYNRSLKKYGGKFFCSMDCVHRWSPSEEVRNKIRNTQLGVSIKSRGRKGHKVTDETKEKIRESYYRYERNPPNLGLVHKCLKHLKVEKYATTIDIIPDAFYYENGRCIAIECQRGQWPSCVTRKIKAYDNLEHVYDEVHLFWLDSKNGDNIAGHWHKKDVSWNRLI